MGFYLIVHIASGEHYMVEVVGNEVVEQQLKERASVDGRHRLGDFADDAAQPCAETAGEDDCFHRVRF